MSGTGGGDYGVPSISPPTNDCTSLKIRTQLSSPVAAVLSTLKAGDRLQISLGGTIGPIQALSYGKVAGTIVSKDAQSLISCINAGHEYEAKITSISGASCEILISIAS